MLDLTEQVEKLDPIRFWIEPSAGGPYEVDLTMLAEGGSRQNVPKRIRAGWAGDFGGRPGLTRQIADALRADRPNERTCRNKIDAIRTFFRFLHAHDAYEAVDSVESLSESMGIQFRRWTETRKLNRTYYSKAKTVLDAARFLVGLKPLHWPAKTTARLPSIDDVDERGLSRLFNCIKGEARSVKIMFREGDRLANEGGDPRGPNGMTAAAWESLANHAWLTRHLTSHKMLDINEFARVGAAPLRDASYPGPQHAGPRYLGSDRAREGIAEKLRWFHPGYQDTAVFLWLFLIGTGWNLATALSLDITDGAWVQDHPHKPDFKIIHATKARAGGRSQFALSLARPEWHPYQVVRYMIERTAVLRQTVRDELSALETVMQADATPAQLRQKSDLEMTAKSPWLFHVGNKLGRVGAFHNDDAFRLNKIAREIAKANNLLEAHPSLGQFGTSSARDAWIGHAYVQSGYSVLLTKLAAQHSSFATLRHYLRQRRFRRHSEGRIRSLQDAAFSRISAGLPLDPTSLKIMVENGAITPEQERRLSDHRQRTRLGMGCLDPRHPPRHIAPAHVEGKLCRVQRCTGCPHGVIFADSLPRLARALAEVRHIQRTMPLAAWTGSSLEAEAASLAATLEKFDREQVHNQVEAWTGKLIRGEVVAHDAYPAY